MVAGGGAHEAEAMGSRGCAVLLGRGAQGRGADVHEAQAAGGSAGAGPGGLQGLGDGASSGSSGRCRNTRMKTRCRGTVAAVQRRAEEEDAWGSTG
jgi:hypothetical protein